MKNVAWKVVPDSEESEDSESDSESEEVYADFDKL